MDRRQGVRSLDLELPTSQSLPGSLRRRPISIGTDGSSPTSWQSLSRIYDDVRASGYLAAPLVETYVDAWPEDDSYEYRLQAMVRWNITAPHANMLRPQLWHTSLLVAYGSAEDPWTIRDRVHLELSQRLAVCQVLATFPPLFLGLPPWKRSWTFGIEGHHLQVCRMLQVVGEILCETNGARLRTRRPLHISWH
jgi:hypothetical protein